MLICVSMEICQSRTAPKFKMIPSLSAPPLSHCSITIHTPTPIQTHNTSDHARHYYLIWPPYIYMLPRDRFLGSNLITGINEPDFCEMPYLVALYMEFNLLTEETIEVETFTCVSNLQVMWVHHSFTIQFYFALFSFNNIWFEFLKLNWNLK